MKRLVFLLVFAVAAISVQAQEDAQPRDLKLAVRNAKGRVMRDLPLLARIKGSSSMETLDRFGNSFFKVTETDTLSLLLGRAVYEFPVAGYDSLYVVFKNRNTIAGVADREDGEIDTGYGKISKRDNTGSATVLDMKGATDYPDLKSYIQGRVAGVSFLSDGTLVIRGFTSIESSINALVVVDGAVVENFEEANSFVSVHDVASVSVLKDASMTSMYGARGSNGVLVITTKRGKK